MRSTTSGFAPSASNRIATGVSATSYSDTGLNASTTYYFRVTATNAGGESTPTSQASATTAGAGLACHVGYSVSSQWNNGFTGAVTIENTGSAAIKSWTLTWAWPGDQNLGLVHRRLRADPAGRSQSRRVDEYKSGLRADAYEP